jgi:hypothetical protein
MTTYCTNAHKAEVIFTIPSADKEGRVVSFSTPVEVEITRIISMRLTGFIDWYEGTTYRYNDNFVWTQQSRYPEGSRFSVEPYGGSGNSFYRFFDIYVYRPDGTQDRFMPIEFFKERIRNDFRFTYFYEQGFFISDAERQLYYASLPSNFTPTWEVKCFTCPNGETPVTQGNDIACLSVPKVTNSLNKALRKLGEL